jgi:hypothetical protein
MLTNSTLSPTSFVAIDSRGNFMVSGSAAVRRFPVNPWQGWSNRKIGMPSNVRTWLLTSWLTACTPHPAADTDVHEVVQTARIEPAPRSSPAVTTTRPLQRWMESDLLYRIRTKDFRGLVRSLDALATVAPPQYPNWAGVASRAAQAARAGDVEAVRRGCAACHQQYRSRYRSTAVACDIDRLIERSRM